jgi:hypothetical protein
MSDLPCRHMYRWDVFRWEMHFQIWHDALFHYEGSGLKLVICGFCGLVQLTINSCRI